MNPTRAKSLAAMLALLFTVAMNAPASAQGRGPGPGRDHDHERDRRDRQEVIVVQPGHVVHALPNSPARIHAGPRDYFYHGGIFYEPRGRDYVVVSAPIGARVGILPPGFIRFGLGGRSYFYFNATFFFWGDP